VLFSTLLRWLPATANGSAAPASETPTTEDDKAYVDHLRGQEGFDIDAGLRSVRGRVASYRRLARLFADSHEGDADRLKAAFEARDLKTAQRIAHTLKGAAGTLGAHALQVATAQLETLLRNGSDDATIAADIETACRLIRQIRDALRAADRSRGLVTEPASIDRAALNRALKTLESLVAEDDTRAEAVLREARTLLEPALGEQYAVLARHLARFDYENALTALREACTRIAKAGSNNE
jgi:HPt (histidine-containing phosphotransfer) domain-containing protein